METLGRKSRDQKAQEHRGTVLRIHAISRVIDNDSGWELGL
jgi:hypothetical protein